MIYYFDTDMNHDADFSALMDHLYRFNVTLHILQPIGPAGGNPYVRIIGDTYEDVNAFRVDIERDDDSLWPIKEI